MKIAYILSTCEKYKDTRVKQQTESFSKYIDMNDVYYLSCKMDIDNRIFGWNSLDDSFNIIFKYIYFFQNVTLDYDWYFFGDDDTYVFHERLVSLLKSYDSNQNYYIGKLLDHIQAEWCLYMSGGAGYAISRSLYQLIVQYVRNIISVSIEPLLRHWCDDLSIGLWIVELSKLLPIITIDDSRFNIYPHSSYPNAYNISDAITFHSIYTRDDFVQYDNYLKLQDTTVVLVTDERYWYKALRTIKDIRTTGKWLGMIQVITVDFTIPSNEYNITSVSFPKIDTSELVKCIGEGFSGSDGRELSKIHQWEKLHVFDEHFKKWKRVIFLDAGLRVLDSMDYLLELDYKGKFLCPNDQGDGPNKNNNLFKCQLSYDNVELVNQLVNEYGNILDSAYFLNCIWVYDTEILNHIHKQQFIDIMNKYPLFKTNEMGLMNILLHFKMNYWETFPYKASNGKYLFNWSDYNIPGSKCSEYCYIKYPSIGLSEFNSTLT